MTDPFSKAKSAILRTGLPLEHAVEGVPREIGWRALSPDFPYSRLGAVAAREVDMIALQPVGSETFEADRGETRTRYNAPRNVIVECKYRRPGVYWLFAPYLGPEQPYKWYGPRVDYRGYLAVRSGGTHSAFSPPVKYFVPSSDWLAATDENDSDRIHIPVCARGVAVLDDKEEGATADQSQLRASVQQIRFAFVPFVWSTLVSSRRARWHSGR